MLITLYRSTQLYGGPEEGGWWFDYCELDEATPSIRVTDEDSAYEICRGLNALEQAVERAEGIYGYTSVLSEGLHRSWHIEDERGEDVSTHRPHYE